MKRKLFALLGSIFMIAMMTVTVSAYPLTSAVHGEAMYTAVAPTIDGQLDEMWESAAKWYTNGHYDETTGQAYGYTSIMWDQGNLYLLAVVTDGTIEHCQPDSHTNGVNFWVSEMNSNYTTYDKMEGDYHIFCNSSGNLGNYHEQQYILDEAEVAAAVYEGYYVVECAVPVQTEVLKLRTGKLIGYEVSIDDDCDGDNIREHYCNLQDIGSYWNEPKGLANVKLVGGEENDTSASVGFLALLLELPAKIWEAIVSFFVSIFGLD